MRIERGLSTLVALILVGRKIHENAIRLQNPDRSE